MKPHSRRRFLHALIGSTMGLAFAGFFNREPTLVGAKIFNPADPCVLDSPPPSTEDPRDQARAKDIARRSPEFADRVRIQNRVNGRFEERDVIVNVDGALATVVVWSLIKQRSYVSTFWVDLDQETLLQVTDVILLDNQNGQARVILSDENGIIEDAIVSNEGLLASQTNRDYDLTCSPIITQEPTIEGTCENLVVGLCAAAGGAGCYAACVGLALTTGPGGLACATVCAIISGYGCSEAQNRICG